MSCLISASLLSADSAQLGKEIKTIEAAGADWIHIDVMDGHFVPNLTWGAHVINNIRHWTNLPFDVHLMVQNPDVEQYIAAGANLITFHPEAIPTDSSELLFYIKQNGCKAGLAISPGYNYMQWPDKLWELMDLVLIMAVTPGAGGQIFLQETSHILRHIKTHHPNILVSIDGGITSITALLVKEADVLVSGSFIFSAADKRAAINDLKMAHNH